MSAIDHSFLQTGFSWNGADIQDLEFNFAENTPLYMYSQFLFLSDYNLSDDGAEFSANSSSNAYDQKDVVRFILIDPAYISSYSGIDNINDTLVDTISYRVAFSDVINAGFSEDEDGELQLINHEGDDDDVPSIGFYPGNNAVSGDIVINNLIPDYDELAPGEGGYWLILHELGHAIGGLDDVENTDQEGEIYDNQQYTIMSYNTHSSGVYATGLQLLDIAALQDTYGGRNYATRDENTVYALGEGLGFDGATQAHAFIYTIWDGGGIDTIDASAFTLNSATIDLRQGKFSSIGVADDNVAIAYYTVIENAIGPQNNDILIGNSWNNILTGGAGDDELYGNGIAYDDDAGFQEEDEYRPWGVDQAAPDDNNNSGWVYSFLIHYDTANYSTATAGIVAEFSSTATVTGNSSVGTDTLVNVEAVIGSDYDDEFTADSSFFSKDRQINIFEGRDGDDVIIGNGYTWLSYEHAAAAVTVNQTTLTAQSTAGGDAADVGEDTFTGIYGVIGSACGDTMTGNSYNHHYEGMAGNDVINGDGGTDVASYRLSPTGITATISGGVGTVSDGYGTTDTLTGIEWIAGSEHSDTITMGNGSNEIVGRGGDDVLYGMGGDDRIYGGDGNDTLYGGDGADLLYGRDGVDTLYGDDGGDIFVFEADSAFNGIDVIGDFETDDDVLDLSELLFGYDPFSHLITDFLQITNSGGNSILKVDMDGTGTFGAGTQIATLNGITGLTDEEAVFNNGNIWI